MRRNSTGDHTEEGDDQMTDYEQLSQAALERVPEERRSMVCALQSERSPTFGQLVMHSWQGFNTGSNTWYRRV